MLARIIHTALGRWLPRAAPMIAVAAMAGYALLAGASAAALRASAMGMLVVLAGTIGIASMTDKIAGYLPWVPEPIRDAFAATVAAEAATWPLLQLAGLIASWFRIVIEGLGSLPLAAIVTPYFPPRWLAAAAIVNGGALAGIKLRQFFWQRRVWAALGVAGIVACCALLIQPDGRVHIYVLDVGTGSAILIRTPHGHQLLIDAGPDADRFSQAVGRALPATARTVDVWWITGGRRENIGAGTAVLNRFHVDTMVVADADAWSVTLRSLVQQARTDSVSVASVIRPVGVDGVLVSQAADGRSWLVQAASGRVAVVPPETSWQSIPTDVDGVIFTGGGPAEWHGPGHGFAVIQVAPNNRQGLPVRAVLQALAGAPILRTDRLGTVGLVGSSTQFHVDSGG